MAAPGESVVDPVSGRILETPELRARGIAQLRGKMAAHLESKAVEQYPRDDERFLVAFLRARKYNVDRAFELVNNFATFWYTKRHLIDGLCAEKCYGFARLGMMKMLTEARDIHGNRVVALYMGNLDVGKYTPEEQLAFTVYVMCYLFEDEDIQLHGATYVETMDGFSLGAAMALGRKMDAKSQKELMSLPTNTLPMRIRAIYLIKQPW